MWGLQDAGIERVISSDTPLVYAVKVESGDILLGFGATSRRPPLGTPTPTRGSVSLVLGVGHPSELFRASRHEQAALLKTRKADASSYRPPPGDVDC